MPVGGLSTFQLPSNFNVGNAGLSANNSGGIQSNALQQSFQPAQPANPINFGYTSASQPFQRVQGAVTQNPQPQQPQQQSQQPQNTGGGTSRLNQLQAMSQQPGGLNPVQQTEFNQLKGQQNPQAPDTSAFDNIINPVIQNFESLIGQQQQQTGNVIGGMGKQRQTELDTTNAQFGGQQQELNRQTTQQTTEANNAIEEAKRMYAEMSQGILARYGTTTGTGGFLTEQLGQQTGRNIAQLHQGLQAHLQDINDKTTQVKQMGELAIRGINERFDQQIQQERDNLLKYITQIRGNEAMLQSNKAQMAAQAIQRYQDTVNNLNAQREQMRNQHAVAALNAQTQLQIYGQKGQAMLNQIQQGSGFYQNTLANQQANPQNITPATITPPSTGQDRGTLPSLIQNSNQNIFNPQGGQ